MFYSQNLNLNQAQQIFANLAQLEIKDQKCKQNLYFSATSLYLAQQASSSYSGAIGNWMGGWSQNLSQLPVLTKKMVVFFKNYKKEILSLEESTVVTAIGNMGLLLNLQDRQSKELSFISQALEDLLWIKEKLEKYQAKQALEQSLASSEQNEKAKETSPTNVSTYQSWSYLPQWSSLSTLNWWGSSSSVTEEDRVEDSEANSKNLAFLSNFIHYRQENNNESLKKTIRGLLLDPALNQKERVTNPASGQVIDTPSQFLVDCHRIKHLTFNGENLFVLKNKLNIPLSEMVEVLSEKMGQLVFERVGTLVHQSLMADFVVNLLLSLPPEKILEGPLQGVYFTNASGYEFDLTKDNERVTIKAKLGLAAKLPREDGGKPIGFFFICRQLIFPLKELRESFEGKQQEDIVPGLQLVERISDICPTLTEAHANFDSSPSFYRNLYQRFI